MKEKNRKNRLFIVATGLFVLAAVASCQARRPLSTAHDISLKKNIADSLNGEATDEARLIRLSPAHFLTGADTLRNEETGVLDSNVEWLKKNPRAVLVLEGHCDERGGDRYNMELGDRRARSVKTHLIGKGIAQDRLIMVVSYGDRAPLDPGHSPDAWSANRRVEFIVR